MGDGAVIDVFGDKDVGEIGQPWGYTYGWAYRNTGSRPKSSFQLSEWSFSGINAINGCTTNSACASFFPFNTYGHESDLIISGVLHGTESAGFPMTALELFVMNDISDLSHYGITVVTHERAPRWNFKLPAVSAAAGSYVTGASDSHALDIYLGSAPDYHNWVLN